MKFLITLLLFLAIPCKAEILVSFTPPPSTASPALLYISLSESPPSFSKTDLIPSSGYISDFSKLSPTTAKLKVYKFSLPLSISFGGVISSPTPIASPTPTPLPTPTETPNPTGTPLYVYLFGSSTIAQWSTAAADLAPHIVARRGESGAKLYNLAKVPLNYIGTFPADVLFVYAGSNDLAESKTPESVLAAFKLLVQNVRATRPELVIGFISMIPTATSGRTLQDVVDTNALIKSYCAEDGGLIFVDTHSLMLLPSGAPNLIYISADKKHMSLAGYQLTGSIIKDVLSGF